MVPTVIADDMSGSGKCANNLRLLRDEPPQHEERCLYVVASKHFDQAQRVGIVRSVIVSQRKCSRPWFESNERTAVGVQRGPHALEACPGRNTRQGNATG